MTLQRGVNFSEYFRCYVVGQERRAHHALRPARAVSRALRARSAGRTTRRCSRASSATPLTLCRALGYDLNTVEFAVEDGVPYAIDFMNPAPDADVNSVGAGQLRLDRQRRRGARRPQGARAAAPPPPIAGTRCSDDGARPSPSGSKRNTRPSIRTRSISARTSRWRSSRRASGSCTSASRPRCTSR